MFELRRERPVSETRVRVDDVVELAKLKAAGELTQEECEELLDLLSVEVER